MSKYIVSSSPHITQKTQSTRSIMSDVVIALAPAAIAAIVFFGYHVLINIVVCAAACFGFELIWDLTARKAWNREGVKTSSVWNMSCFVTAMLLALNLPATMKVWGANVVAGGRVLFSFDTVLVCIIGSAVAIILVKQLFGGIGRNFANPAITARIFLLSAFGAALAPVQTLGLGIQASTGATWLSSESALDGIKAVNGNILLNLFIGNTGSAAVGETCVIALLVGYVYLAIRKVIDWRVPLMILGWTAIFALIFDGAMYSKLSGVALLSNMAAHLMSGGLLLGAIFMATDYATSPNTFPGSCIYCFGIALFTVLIRVFANYPEGMSFAILIMNCVTPLIDKYIYPRPFGYVKPERAQKGGKAAKEAEK